MNKANLKAFSQAIANAALSRRSALQLEVAVSFAVHLDAGQAKRLTRAALCEVFAAAGYKSSNPGDLDWRAINRRITAALALFDFLGADEITSWGEGKTKQALLDAFVTKLEPLKIKTTNEILEICGKVGPRTKVERSEPVGTQHVDTPHIKITIPPAATRYEVVEAALGLMKIAEQMASAELEAQEHADASAHAQQEPAEVA